MPLDAVERRVVRLDAGRLEVFRQRTLLGCENCSGNAIDELTTFEYLVTGKLIRTGGAKDARYSLQLTLMKAKSSSPLSSVRVEAKGRLLSGS